MKYQSFNNSCAYAGLANMLLDYAIDTEDFEIVKAANIPYIFRFNEKQVEFMAGSMFQGKKWFDYYLNSVGLEFIEVEIKREEVLDFFDKVSHKCMIGLKIMGTGKHAVIYMGKDNNRFKFLNNKREDSEEVEYYWYDSNELMMRLGDKISIGWIERMDESISMDNSHELSMSLKDLERYRETVREFCCKEHDFSTLEKAKGTLFKAFFIEVFSMMEIIKETEIVNEIKKLRNDYITIMKLKSSAVLAEHLSIEDLDKVIVEYMNVIKQR